VPACTPGLLICGMLDPDPDPDPCVKLKLWKTITKNLHKCFFLRYFMIIFMKRTLTFFKIQDC
jgi:hypothetical protein